MPQLHERKAVQAEDRDAISRLHAELGAQRRRQPPHPVEMLAEGDRPAGVPVDEGGIRGVTFDGGQEQAVKEQFLHDSPLQTHVSRDKLTDQLGLVKTRSAS